jgi:hypothetical protein
MNIRRFNEQFFMLKKTKVITMIYSNYRQKGLYPRSIFSRHLKNDQQITKRGGNLDDPIDKSSGRKFSKF